MSVSRIASRYAKSLIDLAIDNDKLEKVVEDVRLLKNATEQRDFYLLIKSPIVKSDKKLKIFNAIFEERIDSLSSSFFEIIIKKGREKFLPEIADEFIEQYRELKNITIAKVTTAIPITESQVLRIKSELVKLGVATGTVELETTVDPEIIGGFLLEIKDRLYDASVKSKLANLKKEILDNTYIKSL